MTPTRSFLVLFSLFALALNTAGQLCTLDTLGASGVITDIVTGTPSFTAAGTILSGITSVYIEKSASAAGKLWVVASTNNAALRYKTAYDFTTGQAAEATIGTFNSPGTSGILLKNPYALTTDNGGNCWVSDRSNKRVIIFSGCNGVTGAFTTSGTVIGAISNSVTGSAAATTDPTGITASNGAAISVSNPVFLANGASSNKIYAFTKLPTALDANATSASNTSIYTNSLSGPLGIRFYTSVAGSNFLFIADFGNKRVQRVPLPTTGLPLTVGSAVNFGPGGSTCTAASDIGGPSGVSFDTSTSTLFIADTSYNRITTIAAGNTATATSQTVYFPPGQIISSCGVPTSVAQNNVNGPTDVDVGIFTSASITEATVVIADAGNKRVLKLCSATNSLSVSLSITASAATMTGTGSFSLSLSPSFSTSNIGTPSISVSISGTLGGGSLSTTLSVTFSLTTSITTSFTTSLTLSNTFSRTFSLTTSQSYSLSLTNSFTGSYTNSYTNSLSTSVSTSYSTSGLIFCGDGIVNGKEKCDSGVLNGGKSSCCKKNCRLQRGGRVCLKQTNRCLTNRRCDGRGNCRASVVRVDSPCTLSTGLSGRCNSNAVCQA